MILKSIKIKNFRSYYNENFFELSEGLTLIIGGNGDGKTTFFEALEWLFNTSTVDIKESNISAKLKSELEIGECEEVLVSIKFEHNGEKELEKSFKFERISVDNIQCRDFKFIGYENFGSERLSRKGSDFLEECFDAAIRKYCLFKGESTLNVFDNPTALKKLVDTFSGVKQFDDLVKLTTDFELKSLNAVTKEMSNDKKCKIKANELNLRLTEVNNEIQNLKKDIKTQGEAINSYAAKLEILERNQEASEQYQDIKNRIKSLSDKRTKMRSYTLVDYNAMLLDDNWILRSFPKILDEYQRKAASISKEKRKLDKQETERRAHEKGEQEAMKKIQKLANGVVPMPWNLPDKETMEDMLKDHVCKVCGREAPEGSEAFEFMREKLNNYLQHIQESAKIDAKKESKLLFPNSFIDELHNRQIKMSGEDEQRISRIATDISDQLSFIQARKKDLIKIEQELQEAEDEKSRLLIQSSGLTEEMLDKDFNDIKGYFEQQKRAELRVSDLSKQLENKIAEKKEIDEEYTKLEPENISVKMNQRVHTALLKIMKAFLNAKEKNITEFLRLLENNANIYLGKLNENDFHGVIRLKRTAEGSARIELYSEDGSYVHNPSDSQKTTEYMSVLFAISDITTLKREQDYPLLFDAPTSNMGGFKENSFYNVIDKINKQCIIVTKDLLIEDKTTGVSSLDEDQINQLTCSVYRISKAANFSQTGLSTIQTTTKKIK
jgi:DNA sulfur modification protein DndD